MPNDPYAVMRALVRAEAARDSKRKQHAAADPDAPKQRPPVRSRERD